MGIEIVSTKPLVPKWRRAIHNSKPDPDIVIIHNVSSEYYTTQEQYCSIKKIEDKHVKLHQYSGERIVLRPN